MEDQIVFQALKVQEVELPENPTPDTAGLTLMHSDSKTSGPRVFKNEYAELKQLLQQKGLFDQQPAYYTYKILFTLSLLVVSLILLVVVKNVWLQLPNAVDLA